MNAQTHAINRAVSVLAEVVVGLAVVFAVLRSTVVLRKRGPDTTSFLAQHIAATPGQLTRNPADTDARLDLGWHYFESREHERATREYLEVLKLNPAQVVA